MQTRILFIVRGLPGSGKTTTAKAITRQRFAADDLFETDDGYKFDGSKLRRAHDACQWSVDHAMLQGHPVVAVHNTCCEAWEIAPYERLATEHGYAVAVIDLFDAGLSNEQLAERNVHGVPLDAIESMRIRYEHDWRSGDVRPPWDR